MTRREYSERDIHMALDGELPAEEFDGYKAWLDTSPEMKARSVRFEADRDRLVRTFAGVLAEPVPDRLTRRVTGEPLKPVSGPQRWRAAAAAVAMLAIGASGGYLASSLLMEEEAEYRLTENAIAAHVTYTTDSGHEVEIKADRKDYLMDWLSKRTGLKLVAPDLAAEGFELVGGRILPGEKHAAALLLYEDSAGERMTIYVSAEGADKTWGIREIEAGGPSAVYWLDEGWGCAIVGTLPQERLTELAKNAYRQLKAGAGMV